MKTKEAIEHFGTVKELAAALEITQPAIYQWGEHVPPLRAYQISEIMARRATVPAPEQQAA